MSERESTLATLKKLETTTMCMLENQIHRQRAQLDLSNKEIAARMSAYIGESVSPEAVGHYFTKNAGVPLDKIGALMHALELKVVHASDVCVTPDKLNALKTLAVEALTAKCGTG